MTKEAMVKIYDDEGNNAGVTSRIEAEQKGLIIATVVVAIFSLDDEIWLSLRSHNKNTHPGMWDISVAGCVDAGDETNLIAAEREVKEETGLELNLVSAGRLKFVFEENGANVVRLPEIFVGQTAEIPQITDQEADDFAKYPINVFNENFTNHPNMYVPAIKQEIDVAFKKLKEEMRNV